MKSKTNKNRRILKAPPAPTAYKSLEERYIEAFSALAFERYILRLQRQDLNRIILKEGLVFDEAQEAVVFQVTLKLSDEVTTELQVADCRFWWDDIPDDTFIELTQKRFSLRKPVVRAMLIKAGLIDDERKKT